MANKAPRTLAEMAADAAVSPDGIVCPKCGCRDFRRYKSIDLDTRTVRYKACRHCGQKVLTKQDHAPPPPPEQIIREVDGYKEEDSPAGKLQLKVVRKYA